MYTYYKRVVWEYIFIFESRRLTLIANTGGLRIIYMYYFCNGYNILHVPPKRGHRGATLSKFNFLYLGWFHCLYDTGTRNTGLQESWVPGILGCLEYFSTAILGF